MRRWFAHFWEGTKERNVRHLGLTWGICVLFWTVSWFLSTVVAAHWLASVAYGVFFVLTLAVLLRRILRLIRNVFSIEDGELIHCLRRNRTIRQTIELCEPNIDVLTQQSAEERNDGFAVLVKETSLDVLAHARCTHRIRVPWAMYWVFVHLGLVALTFASANLVFQCSTTATQVLQCRPDMPGTLLERLLLYSTVSLDHMSLGNLRSYALPWQTELILVAEVVAGLWIVLVAAPMVFTEAAAFRAVLENADRIERELKNYWSIKFGIST